jgi:hypothetical protein
MCGDLLQVFILPTSLLSYTLSCFADLFLGRFVCLPSAATAFEEEERSSG